jgi:hypothetical protein
MPGQESVTPRRIPKPVYLHAAVIHLGDGRIIGSDYGDLVATGGQSTGHILDE